MPIKYAVVHRSDPNNVGDLAANPLQYFLNKDEYQVIDIMNCSLEQIPTDVPVNNWWRRIVRKRNIW